MLGGDGARRGNVWRVVCVSAGDGDGAVPSLAALTALVSRRACETLIPVDLFFSPTHLCSSMCCVEHH